MDLDERPAVYDELAALAGRLPPLGPWVARAACADGEIREAFTSDTPQPDRLDAARMVCARCPVRAECAAYDATARPTFGLWAGRWRGTGKGKRF